MPHSRRGCDCSPFHDPGCQQALGNHWHVRAGFAELYEQTSPESLLSSSSATCCCLLFPSLHLSKVSSRGKETSSGSVQSLRSSVNCIDMLVSSQSSPSMWCTTKWGCNHTNTPLKALLLFGGSVLSVCAQLL